MSLTASARGLSAVPALQTTESRAGAPWLGRGGKRQKRSRSRSGYPSHPRSRRDGEIDRPAPDPGITSACPLTWEALAGVSARLNRAARCAQTARFLVLTVLPKRLSRGSIGSRRRRLE